MYGNKHGQSVSLRTMEKMKLILCFQIKIFVRIHYIGTGSVVAGNGQNIELVNI